MTRVVLLESLGEFTRVAVRDLLLPVRRKAEDAAAPGPRAADVYLMRLVSSSSYQKVAPYIIHQAVTGKDSQPEGRRVSATAVVRSIFCVYNDGDEQEGALMLLNLMERLRLELLKQIVIGRQFQLSLADGLESMVYPEDSAPYFGGEMVSTWILPEVAREAGFVGR